MQGFLSLFKERWVRVVIAIVISMILVFLPLDYFESFLYDTRVFLRPSPVVNPKIELVLIESPSVEQFKGVPHLREHISFLKKLLEYKVEAVAYFIDPKSLNGTEQEKAEFVQTAQKIKYFVFVANETLMKGEKNKLKPSGILGELSVVSGPLTADSKHFSQDNVTRRMMIQYQDQDLFTLDLAKRMRPGLDLNSIRGVFPFYDSFQAYIDPAPPLSFRKTEFSEIINHTPPDSDLANKVILVGLNLGLSSTEYVRTSYSRSVTAMTAVEMHANMLNTVLLNSAPIKMSEFWSYGLMFLLVLFAVEVVLTMKPSKGLIVLSITVVAFVIAAEIAFWPFGFWFELAHPLLGVFFAYYLVIPYRLIIENRKTWELSEKNRILIEVEELKSNFMGMISHDLKTPLARIQGMVEIIQRDRNPLSEDQRAASLSIRKSTEDLLKFITSILNFNRIESQGVQLHLTSKDLNGILEEVIEVSSFLAKEKGIKIEKSLEPLFSVKLDPDLIRQVIANLVENAIKYSPPGSTVTLTTEERDDHVYLHVSDQGMGIPADEMPHLFGKFFRSRKAKNSTVNGSGLGLYLAHYFAKLHGGRLSAVSLENRGSTFTLELPVRS